MNLDQIRASRAFATATKAAGTPYREKFLSLARKLPSLVQRNGLLATWAFLLAKNDPNQPTEHQAALEGLLEHLRAQGFTRAQAPRDAFQAWVGTDQQDGLEGPRLLTVTREALLHAAWIKRAAEAVCDRDETQAASGDGPGDIPGDDPGDAEGTTAGEEASP